MRSRKFIDGVVNHTYQRTMHGFNIFYDIEDYLVYYTVFSILSMRYRVVVYGLCLMIDHIHSLVSAQNRSLFSDFIAHVTRVFVKEYNLTYRRSGGLFHEGFGSAPKPEVKQLRTSIAYLYNNPVEKRLCSHAQEYRWNFLAYGMSASPFSAPMRLNKASKMLRDAVKEVDQTFRTQNHMTYAMLRRLMARLKKGEKQQFVDYVIVRYSVIRYDLLSRYYGSFDTMLTAINSNAGSEYDISEEQYGRSDVQYRELYVYAKACGFSNVGDVITLDRAQKCGLMNKMIIETHASRYQICKFLHLPWSVSR